MVYFKSKLLVILSFALFQQGFASDIFDTPDNIKQLSQKKLISRAVPKENGDKDAQFWLGEQANVKVTKVKKIETQDWWYAAASKGHKGAIERLILSAKPISLTLTVLEEELSEFRLKHKNLYEQAQNNDPEALFSLGKLYDKPTNDDKIKHDGTRALKYWKLAAKAGHKEAITKIYNLNLQAIEKPQSYI